MDTLRLKQILTNIVTNAIKYTPPHGAVSVSVDLVDLDDRDDFASEKSMPKIQHVLVTVADTGIGMDAAKLSSLFQPFRQDLIAPRLVRVW